ncbi:MAG: endopeptidase La [Bilophila sp.]
MTFDSDNENKNEETPTRRRRRTPRRRAAAQLQDGQMDASTEDMPHLQEIPSTMPLLPLRDVVVFNYMIVPLFVGREQSVQAVEAAATQGRHIFLCAQKDGQVDNPTAEDLYPLGSVALILRLLKTPDGRIKALVQGVSRARLVALYEEGSHMTAKVELLPEPEATAPEAEQEALTRFAREQCERILSMRGIPTGEIMGVLSNVNEPGRLSDLIAANLRLKMEEAQEILQCVDPMDRLRLITTHLMHEAEVATMQVKIQTSAREGMDKAQKEYFLREQLKAIRKELGDATDSDEELEEITKALDKAGLPADVRKEADKQLKRLASMHGDSAEAGVVRTYLDWLAELPWKKGSKDQLDISKAKSVLDEDHYGLEKIKDRILEYLSVRKLNPDSKGPILCFSGPPGVGKTSLGRSIAKALGRKFQRISLGGMRDEAEIRGHRRTYIGAMPGRIIQSMKQAGTRNPVVVLDEIDKLGNDFRGDPSSALLEALDPEQNFNFSDHYLNMPFDLSKVLFICTANHLENIPGALRDRLEIISLPGYTQQEKLAIGHKYILPKQKKENGLKDDDLTLPDAAMNRIIREYTREAGLRNLEREVGSVCRKVARRKAEGEKPPFRVTATSLPKLLGAPRFLDDENEKKLIPGVALGLAWTPAGGEILHIEVSTIKGKGGLILTGQLGDVMKESAQAALTYARSKAEELGIAQDFAEHTDIHIHVPAGATPKDGPSAGVTLVTALLSALTGKSVRGDLCMTGEITLRGRVLPVGGIKEKVLAGVTRGLKHAIIPAKNANDLEDIPHDLLRRITIHTVDTIDEVLPLVFE